MPHGVLEHGVERRTLISAFGATDPLILVFLDNHPATMIGHPLKDEPLVLGGLIVAADAQILISPEVSSYSRGIL